MLITHLRRLPRDLIWDDHNNTPAVMQKTIKSDVRLTWNPDDDRFYVEQQESTHGDWITRATFNSNTKGWENAKYFARKLAK